MILSVSCYHTDWTSHHHHHHCCCSADLFEFDVEQLWVHVGCCRLTAVTLITDQLTHVTTTRCSRCRRCCSSLSHTAVPLMIQRRIHNVWYLQYMNHRCRMTNYCLASHQQYDTDCSEKKQRSAHNTFLSTCTNCNHLHLMVFLIS